MSSKNEQRLENLILEESATAELVSKVANALAKNVEGFRGVNKLIFAMLVMEKSSSVTSSFYQMKTQQIPNVISKLNEELPEFLLAYTSLLRFRSFCMWGTFSSLVFAICGIYLCLVNYLPIELGGPLIILFTVLFVVFSSRLLQLRKF